MGSRSYSIWVEPQACHYKSNPSFGFVQTGEINYRVGNSSSNSEHFVQTIITKRNINIMYKKKIIPVVIFRFSVDEVILKESVFRDEKGKAGEFLYTRTKLNSIKSLKRYVL